MASHRPLTLKQAQDLLRHNEEQIKALHSKNEHLRVGWCSWGRGLGGYLGLVVIGFWKD
jgi:hypothetical protein